VLRTLRQRSLARLRREVEPVEQAALARFATAWHGLDAPRPGEGALLDAIAQLQGAFIPASDLESRVLPSRVSGYDEGDLDALLASGAAVWVGGGASGPHDGKVSIFLTEHLALLPEPREERPTGTTHQKIRELLAARGALFFPQLLAGLGGGFTPEVLEALWDLVWSGEVTNDTLQPLRGFIRSPASRARRRANAARRSTYPTRASMLVSAERAAIYSRESAGRWSLLESLRVPNLTATERVTARVHQLLERHGIVTREAVQAEGVSGGFAAVYGVLKAMEDAGRVRRGYFVAGRGATQFALPGAVDRLRVVREADSSRADESAPRVVTLAAADPANLYGAALAWPERAEGRRPMRSAGALVVLIDGVLAAWLARDERALLTFTEGEEHEIRAARGLIAAALAAEASPDRRAPFFLDEIDGLPVDESPLAEPLRAAGFTRTPRGYLKRSA